MDRLYNIFEREKDNNPGFTVKYNKFKNSLEYRNENGKLTVVFNPDNVKGTEEFYFNSGTKSGLGDYVLKTIDAGKLGLPTNHFKYLPPEFLEIAQRYQYDRDTIGVEQKKNKNMSIEMG